MDFKRVSLNSFLTYDAIRISKNSIDIADIIRYNINYLEIEAVARFHSCGLRSGLSKTSRNDQRPIKHEYELPPHEPLKDGRLSNNSIKK